MTRLNRASMAYKLHSDAQMRMQIVRHLGVEEIWQICDRVGKKLFDDGVDLELITVAKRKLKRLRYVLTSTPLPFNHPLLPIVEIQSHIAELCKDVNYRSITSDLTRVVALTDEFLLNPSNPISEKLIELVRGSFTLTTSNTYFNSAISEWCSTQFGDIDIQILTASSFGSIERVDHAIFLSSPSFIAYNRNGVRDWRFARDPKAKVSDFVMYPFGDQHSVVKGLLNKEQRIRTISSTQPFLASTDNDDLDYEDEWSHREHQVHRGMVDDHDTQVQARFLGLAGNRSVFVDNDSESQIFTVGRDSEGKLDVQKTPLEELRIGWYIVIRTEGASADLIHAIADNLGAKKLRPSQDLWKQGLRKALVAEGSLPGLRSVLQKQYGVTTSNLADWVFNPRRIGPRSQDDFNSICDYLGLQTQAAKLWKDLEKIRLCHQRAGAQVLSQLRASIEEIDAEDPQIKNHGFIETTVSGFGSIGVYRVDHIGEPRLVDGHRLQILMNDTQE